MEKLIYSRLINYLNKNSILHPNQYGFRSDLSTSHALLDVVTTTYDNINKMLYTLLIFIDYKKAFDTVCHKILLSKLEHYGIRGPALNLISSYLNHRTQCVSINDRLSALSHISYGVPQGSILGPLLFLLYIDDINNINTYSNDSIKQYADDTCLVINEINLDKLKAKANKLLLSTRNLCNFIHKGRSRLEDYIGHFASSLLPVNIIVNMLCFCFNCDFKLRWL